MNRQQLQPSPLVEEALIRLGMAAMQVQEDTVLAQKFQTFEVWSHFASQLVFCHYLQLVNITTLLNKLREKVRAFKGSGMGLADWVEGKDNKLREKVRVLRMGWMVKVRGLGSWWRMKWQALESYTQTWVIG